MVYVPCMFVLMPAEAGTQSELSLTKRRYQIFDTQTGTHFHVESGFKHSTYKWQLLSFQPQVDYQYLISL